MREYYFNIEPRDLLFMRDARPMEASDAGLGANFPRGDQIWNAFINAFHARWPEFQDWEGYRHHEKESDLNKNSSFRFGALKTVGPFPYDEKTGTHYFPCPLDLSAVDEGDSVSLVPMDRMIDLKEGESDIPSHLTMAFASSVLGKTALPKWISAAGFKKYLAGETFTEKRVDLYDAERNIGIAIDAESETTVDGKLYQAEYLRFRPGVRLSVRAECGIVGENKDTVDVFAKIADEEKIPLILGGQQGVAITRRAESPLELPTVSADIPEGGEILLKWTLLSPAVFRAIPEDDSKGVAGHSGGWLPTWVDPSSGKVMLPCEKVARKPGERRSEWRVRVREAKKLSATLAAARIGKPVAFSGWDLRTGPKPTMLAAPAGSVYLFKCDSKEDAAALFAALDSSSGEIKRRSTVFGEKGFGVGVVSIVLNSNKTKHN